MNPPLEESQLGLHLPDEGRLFPLFANFDRHVGCPWCGSYVELYRQNAFRYVVRCHVIACGYTTAVRRSSQDAIKEFRVTALLNRP